MGNFEQLAINYDTMNVQEGVIEVVELALVKRVQLMRRHLSWIAEAKVSQESQNMATRIQADKLHTIEDMRIPAGPWCGNGTTLHCRSWTRSYWGRSGWLERRTPLC